MSCDILDYVADEIRSNEARVTLQLDESTDVSNCTYLLVYCRYIHAVQLRLSSSCAKVWRRLAKWLMMRKN